MFKYRPGYLIATEFSALGGVSYERERDGDVYKEIKRADNPELLKESKAILQTAYYMLDRACLHTPIGYYADDGMLVDAKEKMSEVKDAAKQFNELAQDLGSARRMLIEIFPLEVLPSNQSVVRRFSKLVGERLEVLRDTLTSGNKTKVERAFDRVVNLEKLATGDQENKIAHAVNVAKEERGRLFEMLRAGEDPKVAGRKLNLSEINSTIEVFNALQN